MGKIIRKECTPVWLTGGKFGKMFVQGGRVDYQGINMEAIELARNITKYFNPHLPEADVNNMIFNIKEQGDISITIL